ncbi:hypothetical protein DY000_02064006 [Brassica cretica]|uniref:HVA22-like protein n=5 Tax=Brassica TaxID=3705 RepID=A0ABQ7B276_BRACR|nr:hypothetical protein DY000_02064006 [Brassica cretica]
MRGGRRRRSTSGFGLISATRLLTAAKICPRGLTQLFFNYRLIRYTPTRSKIVEDRNRRGMLNQRLEDKPVTRVATMIGSFLTRGLLMVFGYAYPAYECFKTVEQNKPEIQQLQFWCQYWILVAALTIFERVGDTLVSWLPMYSEAKLAFFIYLWFPKTKGTTYVYDSFFKPYVSKHENEIDRSLTEVKTRAGDMAMIYLHKAINHGHTRFFEILQYIAEQSSPKRQSKEGKEIIPPELGDPTLKMTQNKDTVPETESSTKKD